MMKNKLKKASVTALIILGIVTVSCVKQVDQDETINPDRKIPENFDWKTSSLRNINISVDDRFEGKYFYTVEVFAFNPITNETTTVLCGGKAKGGQPFSTQFSCPATLTEVYVRQTDPIGRKTICRFELDEQNRFTLAPKTSSANTRAGGNAPETADGVDFTIPANAVTVKDINDIKAGGVYVIEDLMPKSQGVTIPSCTLYVKGKFQVQKDLTGDVVTIYITKDGDLKGGELFLGKNSKIYNAGGISMDDIYMWGGSEGLLYNVGKIRVRNLDIDGVNVYNHCLMAVNNNFTLIGAPSNVYVYAGILKAHIMETKSGMSNVYMKSKAYVKLQELIMNKESGVKVTGDDTPNLDIADYPLFDVHKINVQWMMVFERAVELSYKQCNNSSLIHGATMSDGQPNAKINKSDCTDGEGSDPLPPIPPDENPDYDEDLNTAASTTYMFEDNWPMLGDYDMNDVVADVKIANKRGANNKVVGFDYMITVKAIGATKRLGLAAQLDGVPAGIVPQSELGQANAVIRFTEDVHGLFGVSTVYINVIKRDAAPVVLTGSVAFSSPINFDITSENFNLFIAYDGMDASLRKEIHVAGFKGTGKAMRSAHSSDTYIHSSRMIWGIKVPSFDGFLYPTEKTEINIAYPRFYPWAVSGGVSDKDWYLAPESEYVFNK